MWWRSVLKGICFSIWISRYHSKLHIKQTLCWTRRNGAETCSWQMAAGMRGMISFGNVAMIRDSSQSRPCSWTYWGVPVPVSIMKISLCLGGYKEKQLILFQQAIVCNVEMGFLICRASYTLNGNCCTYWISTAVSSEVIKWRKEMAERVYEQLPVSPENKPSFLF